MKIKLCESNFTNALKKSGALVLTLSMLSNFTGCTMLKNSATSQTITESTTIINNVGDTIQGEENKLYDFQLLDPKIDTPETTGTYEWTKTFEKLREKEQNVYDLFKPTKKYWRYGIAMYTDLDGERNNYYRIVDNDGNYVGDKIPFDCILVQSVDERISIITLDLNYGVGATNNYVIFDHATGKSTNISATNLKACGPYIYKMTYENGDYCYELMYQNGNLASTNKYSNIVTDEKTGYIYLSTNDETGQHTQILNPKTRKFIEMEGTALEVYNNYIIYRNYKNGYNLVGIYHLEDMKKPLVKKMDNNYNGIHFVKCEDIPMVLCNKDGKSQLATAEGNIITEQYKNIKQDSDCFMAYEVYDNTGEKKHIISLLNEDGEKIVDSVEASEIKYIPGSNAIIFQKQGIRGKYGIMDFDKNIIVDPEYETLGVYHNPKDPEKFAIYGNKDNDKYIERYVFDNNFKEITHGRIEDVIVYEVVEQYYKNLERQKQKSIGNNN